MEAAISQTLNRKLVLHLHDPLPVTVMPSAYYRARHAESSAPVAAEIHAKGGDTLCIPTDVSDAVASIRTQLGPVTVTFLEMDPEQVRQSFILRARETNRSSDTVMPPDAVTAAIVSCLRQPRMARSQQIDIRAALETF